MSARDHRDERGDGLEARRARFAASAIGVGFGLTHPSVDAAIAKLVHPEFRAGALSIRNGTTFLGRAFGPIAFTSFAIATGYRALLLVSGLGALAIGLVGLSVTDSRPVTAGKAERT